MPREALPRGSGGGRARGARPERPDERRGRRTGRRRDGLAARGAGRRPVLLAARCCWPGSTCSSACSTWCRCCRSTAGTIGGDALRGRPALARQAARGVPIPVPSTVAKLLPVAYVVAGLILVMSVVLIYADIVAPVSLSAVRQARRSTTTSTSSTNDDDRRKSMTTVNLGMPAAPPPVLAPRRPDPSDQGGQGPRRRGRPGLGAVDDDDADLGREHHAPADRRADRRRLRHRPRGVPVAGRRRRAARRSPSTRRSR